MISLIISIFILPVYSNVIKINDAKKTELEEQLQKSADSAADALLKQAVNAAKAENNNLSFIKNYKDKYPSDVDLLNNSVIKERIKKIKFILDVCVHYRSVTVRFNKFKMLTKLFKRQHFIRFRFFLW